MYRIRDLREDKDLSQEKIQENLILAEKSLYYWQNFIMYRQIIF